MALYYWSRAAMLDSYWSNYPVSRRTEIFYVDLWILWDYLQTLNFISCEKQHNLFSYMKWKSLTGWPGISGSALLPFAGITQAQPVFVCA
jgi:hypothetical protein